MSVGILIPAKGKSKRIHKKNLQKLGDKTLIEICCEKAINCKNVDKIILNSDSNEIIELCSKYKSDSRFNIAIRDIELIGDNIGTPAICKKLLVKDTNISTLGVLHSTAPFLTVNSIDKAIEMFLTGQAIYDSLFTVEILRDYLWKDAPLNFNVDCTISTDEVEVYYKLTGGLFISSRKYILENETFIGKMPLLFSVPVMESLDINYQDELELARHIYENLNSRKNNKNPGGD